MGGAARWPIETQIVQLVNQQRAANGLAPVSISSQLTAAASIHDGDMAKMSYSLGYDGAMQHDLNGVPLSTMDDRLMAVGYDYAWFGENIAYGFTSAQAVVNAWMNSPEHKANLLSKHVKHIAVGAARSGSTWYVVQDFIG